MVLQTPLLPACGVCRSPHLGRAASSFGRKEILGPFSRGLNVSLHMAPDKSRQIVLHTLREPVYCVSAIGRGPKCFCPVLFRAILYRLAGLLVRRQKSVPGQMSNFSYVSSFFHMHLGPEPCNLGVRTPLPVYT